MEQFNYQRAKEKAQLVERNPCPNGVSLLDPCRVSVHDENDIVCLASQIQDADKHLKSSACGKLSLILDQIKMLQAQAVEILRETEQSRILHTAACNFAKKPGNIYHLYRRSSGQNYFSMLSPEEWNGSINQKYLGSFRLEYDSSWTPIDKIEKCDKKRHWAEKCFSTSAKCEKSDSGLFLSIDEASFLQNVE